MADSNSQKSKGFTLIELIVMAGIIVLLSVLVLPNYKSGGNQLALQRSANKITQDLRRAQEMAMSAAFSGKTEGAVPLGGYGIRFTTQADSDKYILYGDKNNDHQYDSSDYLVEEISLEKGVFVTSLETNKGSKNNIFITYVPPDPKAYIVPPGDPEPEWLRITIALKQDPSKTNTVFANKVGLVTVEETTAPPSNQAPSISLATDSPDPVDVGGNVTFNVDWSDPNPGDLTKIHICKTNAISGQACTGASWCDSGSFSVSSPISCQYTVQSGDAGATKNYYAFVCDDDNACSSATLRTFTVNAAAPSLYENYITGNNNNSTAYGTNWRAQTFTPAIAHAVTSVKLLIYRSGSPGTLTVSIRVADGSGHPTGADLCSGTTNGNTLPTGSPYEWRGITMGSGCDLVASTKYAIVLRAPSGNSSNYARWRYNSAGTYAGGNRESSTNGGSSWTTFDGDFMFEEWGI